MPMSRWTMVYADASVSTASALQPEITHRRPFVGRVKEVGIIVDEMLREQATRFETRQKRISMVTIEPSPNVLRYGVMILNSSLPKPGPDVWSKALAPGVTRPSALGAQKFNWNTRTKSFEKAWINTEADGSDTMVPIVSAARCTRMARPRPE
jgi:hypothetical protein